jgi:hypothetical protein
MSSRLVNGADRSFASLTYLAERCFRLDRVKGSFKKGRYDRRAATRATATAFIANVAPLKGKMKKLSTLSITILGGVVSLFGQQPFAPQPNVATSAPVRSEPRVFLQSASHGNRWAARRDQSMEMSKDFEKNCPDVRVTINQQMADYTVLLNHIEVGFARDNQFQIADKSGDLISHTKEGGSVNGGVKKACQAILTDWAKK